MQEFDEFAHQYEALLSGDAGVTIRWAPRSRHPGQPHEAADHFVAALGFRSIGRWWDLAEADREYAGVPPGDFAGHLAWMLQHDLVPSHYHWLAREDANACAARFYACFATGSPVRLTNRLGNGSLGGISRSTIEAAYVAMDDLSIGLFLLEAED